MFERLQQEIASYQSRVSLSPAVEEQYKQLTRDYDNAQKNYEDLLAKKSSADLTVKMNNQAVGERMFPLQAADLPDNPSFPNRLFFALGGLAAGFAIGAGIALSSAGRYGVPEHARANGLRAVRSLKSSARLDPLKRH